MIITNNETYEFVIKPRNVNSPYEYERQPIYFRGRPANQMEVRNYRIQKGVNGNDSSVFILSSNLPDDIKVGDIIVFLDKEWVVNSIGSYLDLTRNINASIMSNDYLREKAPKGINIS